LSESFDNAASIFLEKYFPHTSGELKPVLLNDFLRITLVGKDVKERITLDSNISFSDPEGKTIGLPFLAILEIKKERHSGDSPICNIMKTLCIQPNGFSKYSMGSSLIREMPRVNTLKSKILLLNKIENEYIKYA
jgi:hypothetical protein